MDDLAEGLRIETHDHTPNHWLGRHRDVVLLFAYEGAYDDPRHVHAAADLVECVHARDGAPVKLFFVVQARRGARPPSVDVRRAVSSAAKRLGGRLSHVAIVVAGARFHRAIERGVTTAVVALLRPRFALRVVGTVRDGLAHVVDQESAGFEGLVAFAKARAASSDDSTTRP